MLASIIVFGVSKGTFDLTQLRTEGTSTWLFLGFVAAFAVKAPLFPFHGWLRDAYSQAPAEVAGVLSGVVSKAAAYGFLYIAILSSPARRQTFACRSSRSPRSASSTARCSRSARPTSEASSPTRASPSSG